MAQQMTWHGLARPATRAALASPAAVLVALALIGSPGLAQDGAAAAACLVSPKTTAPAGKHWYYRIERPSGRKCWYLDAAGRPVRQPRSEPAAKAAAPPPEVLPPSVTTGRGTAGLEPVERSTVPAEVSMPAARTGPGREAVPESAPLAAWPLPAESPGRGADAERPAIESAPMTPAPAQIRHVDARKPAPTRRAAMAGIEGGLAVTPATLFVVFAVALGLLGGCMYVAGNILTRRRRVLVDPGRLDRPIVGRSAPRPSFFDAPAAANVARRPPRLDDADPVTQLWQVLRDLERRPS